MEADERRDLIRAGAAALRFNAPLSDARAEELAAFLAGGAPSRVVDLGCGRGAFVELLANRIVGAELIGVDNDDRVLAGARSRTAGSSTVRFELGDASSWRGSVDAAVCIGASHAFGGADAMLARLAALGAARAVIGDGVWSAAPDEWCLETFGELPEGVDALASAARRAGWTVAASAESTLEEWDAFELGWIEGVREVGTPVAAAFADQRLADYGRYRGTLGFGWLCLRRQSGA